MASSRLIWVCLLVTICLFKAGQSAPLNTEEEEDINEIDFEEENLDDFDDVLKDPDYVPEFDDDEWDDEDEEWDDDEWEDDEEEENNYEDDADEENEASKIQNRRKRDLEDLDDEDPDYVFDFDEPEWDDDDGEWDDDEWEDDEEKNDSQNRRKRDLEDLDGEEEEEIDPDLKELKDLEEEEDSGINFSLKDRGSSQIRDELFFDSLDEEKLKDTKYLSENVKESLDFLNDGDLKKPVFMEDMHRGALELLRSISKSDSE